MEADPSLRRIGRTAVAVCVGCSAIALVAARFDPRPALGVLGGGVLIFVSYASIRAAVTGMVGSFATVQAPPDLDGERAPARRVNPWTTGSKLALRYALLGILAYVMIARLRLHPVGLVVGASSVVAAAGLEAVRLLMKKP